MLGLPFQDSHGVRLQVTLIARHLLKHRRRPGQAADNRTVYEGTAKARAASKYFSTKVKRHLSTVLGGFLYPAVPPSMTGLLA